MFKNKLVLAVGAAAALISTHAYSASVTDTLTVQATVVAACTVTGGTLDFGDVDPIAGDILAVSNTTNISVTCSALTPYNVRLSAGTNGNGSVTGRQMLISGGGSDKLAYSLWRDALGTLNWGETDGDDTVSGLGTGLAIPHAVYGTVPAAQTSPPGSYTDTVTITVSY